MLLQFSYKRGREMCRVIVAADGQKRTRNSFVKDRRDGVIAITDGEISI